MIVISNVWFSQANERAFWGEFKMENLQPTTARRGIPHASVWLHGSTIVVAAALLLCFSGATPADAGQRRARLSSDLATHVTSGTSAQWT